MTAERTAYDVDQQSAILLEIFHELDAAAPEVIRAQLVEGEMVVTTAQEGRHEHCWSELTRQLVRECPEISISARKGLVLPSHGPHPDNHLIPDLTVVGRREFRGAPPWWRPDGELRMVAEITGDRPELDRIAKCRSYALGAVPLYLLIDRERATATLHSRPSDGDYLVRHSVRFGTPLPLPAPFSFDLETADFL
ncbi:MULTISPECIES: Uma2 family endonuclease [unclassified Streptomyces]|uniref:Uma2 family endonuclease n=1 Tax=unclassified Streptomyces TaxID=2593676 RepID=UPI000377AEC6|nr:MULTISPECIES: Uma2 family endonuclease [unclassified Streptomyces]MYT30813.1 Uma2 family endonuclease [Streptomyces sp. SID8354]